HQRAVAHLAAALFRRRYVGRVIYEIPAVDVVYVAVTVVIDTGSAVELGLVRPQLVPQVLMIDVGAVVEDRDDDRFLDGPGGPLQRPRNRVDPPEVAGAIGAVIGVRIIDGQGGQEGGAFEGLTG